MLNNEMYRRLMEPEVFHQTRMAILRNYGITVFIDGGANKGQFAQNIRLSGYNGRIISFEPASAEFVQLAQLAAPDPLWDCHKIALGAAEGYVNINLAGNSYSSSLLPMLDQHLISAPDSKYIGVETVRIGCLDNDCSELLPETDRVYLKLDLQGYEMEALKGANNILKMTSAIEMELALVPLYSGQTLFTEMINFLAQFGFQLHYCEINFTDSVTGKILELNGIFLQ
ncbi:FkbM family methyltransferase [Paenibacillus prosopidis]|uniref:FkbM family methyltransferase n=1 Tax=Paenibacillus prosopidis TaxID=630520 RepID=A0A368W7R3_9BACL|nr:FkbM family methyltransferase [Paenibacillus prosopidis]RCW50899.1 FkbM family methyltransferase [Paenibacillus prosopidis]